MSEQHPALRFSWICPSAFAYARHGAEQFGALNTAEGRAASLLLIDAYNKARGYSTINKVAAVPAVIFSLLVVGWPFFEAITTSTVAADRVAMSAAQSFCAALAGTCMYVYVMYKRRQTVVEAAMRHLIIGAPPLPERLAKLAQVLNSIDSGLRLPNAGGAVTSIKNREPAES